MRKEAKATKPTVKATKRGNFLEDHIKLTKFVPSAKYSGVLIDWSKKKDAKTPRALKINGELDAIFNRKDKTPGVWKKIYF